MPESLICSLCCPPQNMFNLLEPGLVLNSPRTVMPLERHPQSQLHQPNLFLCACLPREERSIWKVRAPCHLSRVGRRTARDPDWHWCLGDNDFHRGGPAWHQIRTLSKRGLWEAECQKQLCSTPPRSTQTYTTLRAAKPYSRLILEFEHSFTHYINIIVENNNNIYRTTAQ